MRQRSRHSDYRSSNKLQRRQNKSARQHRLRQNGRGPTQKQNFNARSRLLRKPNKSA